MLWASSKFAMSSSEGAKTQLWAATSPEVDEQDLKYVHICKGRLSSSPVCGHLLRAAYLIPIATVDKPSAYAQDSALAEQLWTFSERAVKELSQ
jgi:hypothetical protein